MTAVPAVAAASGQGADYHAAPVLPPLGQGACFIGERDAAAETEKAALLRGLSHGMNLIDTAEMYGDGGSERLIGDLLRSRAVNRADVILMSKVYPWNASPPALSKSCENSLNRLGTDYIDIYLLHWRGDGVDLAATVCGMEELVRRGLIRRWGVSNFDVADMEELMRQPHGSNCAVDQVMYNLGSRGVEYDLLPWLQGHNITPVAYCPLAQGGRLRRTAADFTADATLAAIARKYGASIFQIMLAFVLRNRCSKDSGSGICAIPKAASAAHVDANAAAPSLANAIEASDWEALDRAYPPPAAKMHLDMD